MFKISISYMLFNSRFFLSSEDSSADDQENFMKQLYNYITPLLFIGLLLSSFSFGSDKREVRDNFNY